MSRARCWTIARRIVALVVLPLLVAADSAIAVEDFDVIIRGGTVYDGSGAAPRQTDVGIRADRIVALGDLDAENAAHVVDASGLAVAPGFINMLSWSTTSLIHDGRSMSEILQGVTLEVFGEGWSQGPLNETMRTGLISRQTDVKYEVPWTTLAEYLDHLVDRGVSCNVASFVGATTVRIHELGYEDRPPTPAELDRMCQLVRQAMEDGAMGVGSSLIYAPAFYADTEELIALCKVAAEFDGLYITHMRSEANQLLEAVDEVLRISDESGIRSEIYHLKAAGQANWPKMDQVIRRIEAARAKGVPISADMYTYIAGSTGLNGTMPPWVQEGGLDQWIGRLRDPKIRQRVIQEMRTSTDDWENLLLVAGSPERVLLVGFKNENLKHLTGSTLGQVAARRGESPEETAINLVIEDGSRVETVYFMMSEENVRRQLALDWVSFGSDSPSMSAEGVFLKSQPHPRGYGNFARLLGKYVRDEKIIPLAEAIRRLTSLPAENLRITDRGRLAPNFYADVVVFDPEQVQDHATFEEPHQYATGMRHVFVNGAQVIDDGKHTGATPGRVVHGPGYRAAKRDTRRATSATRN